MNLWTSCENRTMQIFSVYNISMDSQEQDKVGSSSISLARFVKK